MISLSNGNDRLMDAADVRDAAKDGRLSLFRAQWIWDLQEDFTSDDIVSEKEDEYEWLIEALCQIVERVDVTLP